LFCLKKGRYHCLGLEEAVVGVKETKTGGEHRDPLHPWNAWSGCLRPDWRRRAANSRCPCPRRSIWRSSTELPWEEAVNRRRCWHVARS
jgi:hypothetical protein